MHCAIADEGVAEVAFDWSPEYTQGGSLAREGGSARLRVPAASLASVITRHALPDTAWLVMDIEGMEWDLARRQAGALRHFAGIIVECHDVREGGRTVPHEEVVAELAKAGFEIRARRGQVSVLLRRPS